MNIQLLFIRMAFETIYGSGRIQRYQDDPDPPSCFYEKNPGEKVLQMKKISSTITKLLKRIFPTVCLHSNISFAKSSSYMNIMPRYVFCSLQFIFFINHCFILLFVNYSLIFLNYRIMKIKVGIQMKIRYISQIIGSIKIMFKVNFYRIQIK